MSQINFEDETLDASDGVTRLLLAAEYWKEKATTLRAKIAEMEQQEPVGTAMLCVQCSTPFDGEYYCPTCGHHTATEETVYALPGAQPAPSFADAYHGAMEDVAIWKKRALEAEDLNRKFVAEINGPAYMGEPAQPAPSVPEGWKLVPIEPTPGMIDAAEYVDWGDADVRGSCINAWDRMLAAAPEAKP